MTLFLGVITSSFAIDSSIEYKNQSIVVDKIIFTIVDKADKRIVTASSDNKKDITAVYDKSTGKITKDGKVIGQVKNLGRVDKDSSKNKSKDGY
ncbi:hypothetical protein [Paramaledivibacter caminithermalis]|uniref:Uncharacterized protein n=1 Tax=Paramaledivibacter caminithermalis (strain DSM 15212 / CIP 107654 / DViRD3) TaxID=1121301 RepID=A0A1M6T274_PARC5|nr:hypothetical protein [Paramaledivibacter caminithermalis]SHK51093.1 hypothetical protein SAMN02745912_03530 [Paramaledivibacter caminithermalis DSM 15212]